MPPEPRHEPARPGRDDDSGGDNNVRVAGMIVGTALIFIGFLDIFLSISGGFEIDFIPFLIYFGGVAVWSNAVVENATLRYSIIAGALILAAVFFHYGEEDGSEYKGAGNDAVAEGRIFDDRIRPHRDPTEVYQEGNEVDLESPAD